MKTRQQHVASVAIRPRATSSKWCREVRAMAECEGLTMERMALNGSGHLTCCVSLDGVVGSITVPRTSDKSRTPMEIRASLRRLARMLKAIATCGVAQ